MQEATESCEIKTGACFTPKNPVQSNTGICINFAIKIVPGFLPGRGQQVMNIIRVAGTSRTSAVAGAIAGVFRDNQRAEVQAIGAIAVNQAVKALALARGYLQEDGYEVIFYAEFVDVEIEEKTRTAIKFTVESR